MRLESGKDARRLERPRGGGALRRLAALVAIAAVASVAGGGELAGARGLVQKRTPAHFVFVQSADGCHGGAGIVVSPVPGAVSYTVRYWDGYYKQVITGSVTVDQFKQNAAGLKGYHGVPSGDLYTGVTGGWGSPPCKRTKGDPTYGGRFSKGAEAWAVFPPGYKPKKPTVSISVILPQEKATVGSSVDVEVKVTAGKVALAKVNLGKGLKGTGSVAAITDRPTGLNGFSLAPHHSRVFAFTLEAKREGTETLSAQADASSSAGGTAQATDSQGLSVGLKALAVTVSPNPSTVRLDLDGDRLTPEPVKVKVFIRNNLKEPVLHATLQGNLSVSYLHTVAKANAEIPIRPVSGPSPESFDSIEPGQTVTATYTVLAKGDGDYSLEALVRGEAKSGGTVGGVGSGELDVTAPVLVVTTAEGRGASLPDAHGMVIAGTPFTIKLTLKNLSYVHKIAVNPFYVGLAGNAFGGQVVLAGGPIETTGDAPPAPPRFLVLEPQQTLDAEAIVYTTQSQGILQNIGRQGVGGTRATVTVPTPGATYVNDDGSAGDQVEKKDVAVYGDTTFTQGIDDRDLYEPQTAADWAGPFTGALYFSAGLVEGAANFFSGMVHAIPQLPSLLAQGLIAIPPALYDFAHFEATLWDSLANQPQAKNAFLDTLSLDLQLVYKNAEGFAGSDFVKQIKAAADDYFGQIADDYAKGNWQDAVEQIGETTGEQLAPVAGPKLAMWLVRGMGPGILARSGPVLKAFAAQQNKLFTAFGEELTARFPKFARALDAVSALRDAAAGYEFTDTQIRQLYGLTQQQVQWLRDFAKANDLLIVCRSRAVESIAWLNGQVVDGVEWAKAVLKSEAIKLKNVSTEDWQYFGYNESDIGRVVINTRELPSASLVESRMIANGIERDSPEWNLILKRLAQRQEEFSKGLGTGNVKDLIAAAEKGEMTMDFNLAGNSVEQLASEPTKYGFRLVDEKGVPIPKDQLAGYKGSMIPEYDVDGEWRCVTGDVDFLQIAQGNGSPLGAAERASVYRAMAGGPIGFLHGESATWTLDGAFDFEKKVNEFKRAGTALEFAPDGLARAVKFLAADFKKGVYDYKILWDGSAVNPLGAVTPPH